MGLQGSLPLIDDKERVLELNSRRLKAVPYRFPEEHQLTSMFLKGNKIQSLPKNLIELKDLDLTSNKLKDIKDDMLSAILSYPKLENLSLENNSLNRIDNEILSMHTLKRLNLRKNRIRRLDIQKSSLQALQVQCNLLTEFNNTADSLCYLDISFNRLRSFNFTSANLTCLYLSGNKIRELPSNVLPNVSELDLSFNALKSLPDISELFPKLTKFNFSHNEVSILPVLPVTITDLAFDNNLIVIVPDLSYLVNLSSLAGCSCRITEVGSLPISTLIVRFEGNSISKFGKANYCIKLDLCSNSMDEIPDFSECYVQFLGLASNKLEELEVNHLSKTITLLDVSNNNISVIPPELFKCEKLQSLDISHNDIREIPPTIIHAKLLQTLVISGNPLSELPHLPYLIATLIAFNCEFSVFPESIIELRELKMLNLSFNNLTFIPPLPTVAFLFIAGNNIEGLQLCNSIRVLDASFNKIAALDISDRCFDITDIDVSHNSIKSLVLGQKDFLRILRVNHNPNLDVELKYGSVPSTETFDITKTRAKVSGRGDELKDIYTSDLKEFTVDKTYVTRYIDPNTGVSEMRGVRQAMEDSVFVRVFSSSLKCYAVFDGHGGFLTASWGTKNLHLLLNQVKEANEAVLKLVIRKLQNSIRRLKVEDGSTLALAVIQNKDIYTVNIGDSRIIIVKDDGTAKPLTTDHKPTESPEFERIRQAGAYVREGRTSGVLAISRSLGDFEIPGVIYDPDVSVYKIEEDDAKLVICCDGVYDVMSNDDVAKAAMKFECCHRAATFIRNYAYSRGSQDNISVIVTNIK